MHCWFNGLLWHTNHALLVAAGFMSMASEISRSQSRWFSLDIRIIHADKLESFNSPVKEATTLHIHLAKLHNEVMSWISMNIDYAWPYLKWILCQHMLLCLHPTNTLELISARPKTKWPLLLWLRYNSPFNYILQSVVPCDYTAGNVIFNALLLQNLCKTLHRT